MWRPKFNLVLLLDRLPQLPALRSPTLGPSGGSDPRKGPELGIPGMPRPAGLARPHDRRRTSFVAVCAGICCLATGRPNHRGPSHEGRRVNAVRAQTARNILTQIETDRGCAGPL